MDAEAPVSRPDRALQPRFPAIWKKNRVRFSFLFLLSSLELVFNMFYYSVHMCTEISNVLQGRFVQLARMGEVIFHTSDLANLWGIRKPNTLYTTLKRYVKSGLIYRIQKGMYSLLPVEELDPILLGVKTIHKYAYVSTETVLFNEGIINQRPRSITIVSSLSMKFKIHDTLFISRQLNDAYLFNSEGVLKNGHILTASVERAAADLLYFNPKTYFDNHELIHWEKVIEIQDCLGQKITRKEISDDLT
jgi:hypothetical protein